MTTRKKKAPTTLPDQVALERAIERLRPAIQSDGGDVSLESYKNGVARVVLKGACATCPISTYTLKLYIEQKLKQEVPGVKRVEQV